MASPAPDQLYRGATRLFAAVIIGFGVAILVVTLSNGGGPGSVGVWLGLLFVALGCGRFYLSLRARG